MHIISCNKGKSYHYIYNINTKQWTLNETMQMQHRALYVKIIYSESTNAFIVFGSRHVYSMRLRHVKYDGLKWISSRNTFGKKEWDSCKYGKQNIYQIFEHLLLIRLENKTFMIFDLLTLKWFG